jgi:hypothetical protein
MSLALYPLAAAVGTLIGIVAHEFVHALAAAALRLPFGFGRQGVTPYVAFRTHTRLQSEIVRKAPIAVGSVALLLMFKWFEPTLGWYVVGGAVLAMVGASREDLFWDAADQGPVVANRRATRRRRRSTGVSERRRCRLPAKRAQMRRRKNRTRP